jgi:TatD DNase family protein
MSAPLIDICFNFTHPAFRTDEPAVIERAVDAGIRQMIVTGSDVQDSEQALALARRYPLRLRATAGVHPHHASAWQASTAPRLAELAGAHEVVAVGEAGLDFNRNYSTPAEQEYAFEAQLELASDLGLPMLLHERDAHERFMALLGSYRDRLGPLVLHCFTGSGAELDAYLDLDLHIGITGWICDERRGLHLRELVTRIPLERLMLETDAPYLLPRDLVPRPRDRRNEPAFLGHIAAGVASAYGLSTSELAAATSQTASSFFGLSTADTAD